MKLRYLKFLVSTLTLTVVACAPAERVQGSGDGGDGETTGFEPGVDGGSTVDEQNATTGAPDGTGAGAGGGTDVGESTGEADSNMGAAGGTTGSPEPIFQGISGFPSTDMFIQIVGPSADRHVTSSSGVTYVAGVLFGMAEKIVWQSTSGETGAAKGDDFWETGPITLAPGDNEIVVKAISVDGTTESEDRVTITYNPGFSFSDRPVARPAGFFTNQSVDVVVTFAIRTKNFIGGSVELWEVDAGGNTVGKIGPMIDDGVTSSPGCDEIDGDGLFSRCVTLESPSPTTRWLRSSLRVMAGGEPLTIWSPMIPVEIVDPVPVAECQQMQQLQKDTAAMFANSGGDVQAALDNLKNNPLVADAGVNVDGHGIWTQYHNGIMGGLNTSGNEVRGGDQADEDWGQQQAAAQLARLPINSKHVLAWAPFNAELGAQDEVTSIAAALAAKQCPAFNVEGPLLNGDADLAALRDAHRYGVLLLSGHADVYFTGMDLQIKRGFGWEHDGGQEILWSGEAIDCSSFSSQMPTCSSTTDCPGKAECVITTADGGFVSGVCVDQTQVDLRRGRVIMGAATFGVHPEFFRTHKKRDWPNTLVYLGACKTLFNGTLAASFFGAGARAVAGFTNYVTSTFANQKSTEWFDAILAEEDTTAAAGSFPVADPDNPAAQFALFGARNLTITDSDLLNPSFETGDSTGWDVEGDGRVIGQLGVSIPVGGKYMGILSTGLGYTQQTGELSQSFCIPEDTESMTFYWKFFSEEFLEFCGSVYQDTFTVSLEQAGSGKITAVDVTVDDLCPVGEGGCFECGSQYVGLIAADVSFDQGGVHNTQWQESTVDVSALSGSGPITMRFFTSDAGDSIYDTVVLFDSITFD